MKLNVPLIKQLTEKDCATATLCMVFKFYEGNIDDRKCIRKIMKKPNRLLFNEEIAWIAIRRGYRVAMHTGWKAYYAKTRKEIVRNTRREMKTWKPTNKKEEEYFGMKIDNRIWGEPLIKSVGNKNFELVCRYPNIKDIIKYLKRGIPLIATIDHFILYGKKSNKIGAHNVVVTGFDSNNFYLNDPYYGKKKVSKNKFEKAWSTEFAPRYAIVIWK